MFLTVSKLKGIIIDVDSFPEESDKEWGSIAKKIEIIFFSKSKERCSTLSAYYAGAIVGMCTDEDMLINSSVTNNKICKMLKKGNLSSNEVAIVTCSVQNSCFMGDFPVGRILISSSCESDVTSDIPDFYINDINGIEAIISGAHGGVYGEAFIEEKERSGFSFSNGTVFYKNLICSTGELKTIVAGRYFAVSDKRSLGHQLSRRILANKKNGGQTRFFLPLFMMMEQCLLRKIGKIDAILSIPPKPGNENRFRQITSAVSLKKGIVDLTEYISCVRDYGNNKHLRATERKKNLAGAFEFDHQHLDDIKGKTVLIIDDVLASGATIVECGDLLYRLGAKTVVAAVLGVNQKSHLWGNASFKGVQCSACGNEMVLRINSNNSGAFFGCSKYPDCKETLSYEQGKERLIKENIMQYKKKFDEFF
jgi:predicted amidophosphoribosyltransferase